MILFFKYTNKIPPTPVIVDYESCMKPLRRKYQRPHAAVNSRISTINIVSTASLVKCKSFAFQNLHQLCF